jgi:hypothetical protein
MMRKKRHAQAVGRAVCAVPRALLQAAGSLRAALRCAAFFL